jgi:hypothetical protein
MRQLAIPNAFDSEYSDKVCPAAPLIDPGEKWRASPYVKYS